MISTIQRPPASYFQQAVAAQLGRRGLFTRLNPHATRSHWVRRVVTCSGTFGSLALSGARMPGERRWRRGRKFQPLWRKSAPKPGAARSTSKRSADAIMQRPPRAIARQYFGVERREHHAGVVVITGKFSQRWIEIQRRRCRAGAPHAAATFSVHPSACSSSPAGARPPVAPAPAPARPARR